MTASLEILRSSASTWGGLTGLRALPTVSTYIDTSVCMSCQICVEVCPFDAIKMDVEYELSTSDRFSALLLRKERVAKSSTYYRKIHPAEAAEVDARLGAEKAKTVAAAKPG